MVIINYPKPEFNIKTEGKKELIFDSLRKKWVVLTPEEWVRQNFILYLVTVKKYPSTLVAIEKEIKLGELKKRFDILIYDASHQPWMMIECKAMDVNLDEGVLQQALRYNISVPVKHIIITNGNECYVWTNSNGELVIQKEIPEHS